MRFSQILLFVLSFGLMSLSANTAQAQNTRQLLSQKWDLDIEAINALLNAEISKLEETDPAGAESMRRLSVTFVDQMKSISFDFQPNGTLIMNLPTEQQQGTWRLSPDGQKVISRDAQGNEEELMIVELTKDKLILAKEGDETALQFKPSNPSPSSSSQKFKSNTKGKK